MTILDYVSSNKQFIAMSVIYFTAIIYNDFVFFFMLKVLVKIDDGVS